MMLSYTELALSETRSKTISIAAATSVARILKQEGVEWVYTFPVCPGEQHHGHEGVLRIMMRDGRYAVARADAYSRVTAR
ncbi:MAG: hypothetical protein OXL37_07860 [Chloroflexota bacterium]|nr:hypothetical protein [Chloroflexota bacterium]MDE2960288.1 hypothetical protein [Chloroflexota bacterium]